MAENIQFKERYNALDGLRALACIGIVAMHVEMNMFAKPSENFLTTNIISFTGNFVLLFMMISAFALSCGYFNKFGNGSVRMGEFYKKRCSRILPFFVLLNIIDIVKTIIAEHFSFTDALRAELYESFANCTLLFGLIPNNGITVVGVGWFLGIIFIFYLFYPFFTFLISTKRNVWLSVLLSLGLYFSVENYFSPVKGVLFDNSSFMKCAPYFMVGGLIFAYRAKIVEIMRKRAFRFMLLIATLCYTSYFFALSDYRFPLANLVMYALWLVYAVSEVSFSRKKTLLNNKVMAFLSGLSMEVYLCHMMFFRVVEKFHIENYIENNTICYYIYFCLVLLFAICFSWIWKKWGEPRVLKVIG